MCALCRRRQASVGIADSVVIREVVGHHAEKYAARLLREPLPAETQT